jgi:hypothetical protein
MSPRLLLAVGLVGCASPEPTPIAEPYIALDRDFDAYWTWTEHAVSGAEHGDTDRVWCSSEPAPGEAEFPLGTRIVKQIGPDAALAMVKRGGGYNPDGAPGWEWMGLEPSDLGTPKIVWRGPDVDAAHRYSDGDTGVDPAIEGDCNLCHGTVAANDYVFTVPLR